MKVGMKTYSTQPGHVAPLAEFADYIEVLIVPGKPYKHLLSHDIPFRVHAAHRGFGCNLADPNLQEQSHQAILYAIEAAHELNSPTVVIHPGAGDKALALKALAKLPRHAGDTELLLENLPKKPGERELMNFPEEAPEFLELGFGLCLDIGHAAGAAATLDRDYEEVITGFMELYPHYFHASNGMTESSHDLHMPLMKGEFDFKFFKDQIIKMEDPWVTLETPYNPEENRREFMYFKDVL